MLVDPTPSADPRDAPLPPDTAAELEQMRARETHELIPMAMAASVVVSLAVYAILYPRVPHLSLNLWLAFRLVASVVRLRYSLPYLRGEVAFSTRSQWTFRGWMLVDSVGWSALGWGLTPLDNLEVAVITIPILTSVAAVGGLMLQTEAFASRLFAVPILLPNALYALTRPDDLGFFCCVAVLGLMGLLLFEGRRASLRLLELQRLRVQSEQTQRTQAEALERARELSETKSRFVAAMSHEMRTPLHGILGLLRMVRGRVHETETQRQLDLIRASGDHLLGVINEVLDFSRMQTGPLPVHPQPFDLHALVSESAVAWDVNCRERGLKFILELDIAAGQMAVGDPMRIRQVLYNLVGNAMKFTSRGFVLLRVGREAGDSAVSFCVQDSGIGIPADELPRIFDAFHQVEGTYARRFGGSGLGLTISRELCRAMGGELGCRSREGIGTIFEFTLPLPVQLPGQVPAWAAERALGAASGAEAGVAEAHAQGLGAASGGAPAAAHVLLVEDNEVNAMVAEAELQALGVQVSICRNGLEAVEWLQTGHADLVLMDCEMPVLDGLQATRRIRDEEQRQGRPRVRIVALTANGPEIYAQRCREAGMDDHLIKPFRPEDLARIIARNLLTAEHAAG